ncbi:MAG: 6,7-dimethyl-8-ribityllumazine synthase [Muribaculaceae bacterium]|nr:6,7-dimethyl-8-ribityllumazine synthase [Muribaculaceae bacterium]
MSSELKNREYVATELPKLEHLRVGIVAAKWNSHITDALVEGALQVLDDEGYGRECADVMRVPGTVELTYGAARMMHSHKHDAIIVVGCVIRGGTPHFDYVCDSVTQGVTHLNEQGDVPVIFCVLTVDDEQQALDRAGGALCNKGTEAAQAAIEMVAYDQELARREQELLEYYKSVLNNPEE